MSTILELKNVRKEFFGLHVVDGFDFTVNKGELRCLLGPNGAGKTTTIDLITGRLSVSSGQVIFRGEDITRLDEAERVRRGIGRKFQVPAVFRGLTVRDNFFVAYNRRPGPFRNMLEFSRARGKERIESVTELVGLKDRLEVLGGNLSHGETQWLEIGMVLIQNCELLLMDEPTSGMTAAEKQKTTEIFASLKNTHSLIVVEHDMGFVREIADVVTLMHMGKLLAEGQMAQIENDPRVREVYLGTESHRNAA